MDVGPEPYFLGSGYIKRESFHFTSGWFLLLRYPIKRRQHLDPAGGFRFLAENKKR
jgi:hypothetical protein